MTEPTLDEQIAAMRRITARLEAGGVVMAYPDELPALNAILAKLEAHLAPLLADPVHPLSADDDEREAQIRQCMTDGVYLAVDQRMLLRYLDAARHDLARRDAEIERLRQQVAALHETCKADIRTMGILRGEIVRLNAIMNTPPPIEVASAYPSGQMRRQCLAILYEAYKRTRALPDREADQR